MLGAADHHLMLRQVLEPTSSYWMNEFSTRGGTSPSHASSPDRTRRNILYVPGGDYDLLGVHGDPTNVGYQRNRPPNASVICLRP